MKYDSSEYEDIIKDLAAYIGSDDAQYCSDIARKYIRQVVERAYANCSGELLSKIEQRWTGGDM